jgi:hypothetical protein
MPAGLPYFAWIDASETTFGSEHLRWDEAVFSFTLKQDEGDPASLTVVVRRPVNDAGESIGLLGPGRKIWAWFALDCGPALIKFRGRLVGIPTSIFEELVTLEFVARPFDVVAQKEALAETLKVLPYYDEAVIDKAHRDDPDVVLEGYTKIWHYDRESGPTSLTVSDEISGEDGLVEFDGASEDGKILYDGLGLTLTSGPLARVDVNAEYTWTQQARGTVDLTNYLLAGWGGYSTINMNASDWPKSGTGIGDGWTVAESSAQEMKDTTPATSSTTETFSTTFAAGDSVKTTVSVTFSALYTDFFVGRVVSTDEVNSNHSTDGDGIDYVSSWSHSLSYTDTAIVVQQIKPTLVAAYEAGRSCTERVSFSLFADVQSILTDPEDGEALRIDDIKSVNLSDPEEGTPIGDPRRRSYIATARGNQSLEHLIALARANLMKRARVVEIAFAPKLARMPEVTLRKNAFLAEPRVGEALGKIVSYSIALDGSDGRVDCEIRMGCCIGYGGNVTATEGVPSYCSVDYVGFDYQRFVDRTVLVTAFTDSSVGYQPPDAAPNDDGIDFLSALRPADVIDVDLVVERGPDPDDPPVTASGSDTADGSDQMAALVSMAAAHYVPLYEQRGTFKLKSMTREFSSDYELQVTDLKIPAGYDLEKV